MLSSCIFTTAVSALALTSGTAKTLKLSPSAQDYFDYSMEIADSRFDSSYGYIWYLDNGIWSTRFTSWYIPGLLHRNKGNDVKNAEKALRSLINVQMNENFTSSWYADYKLSPDEPNPTYVGELYPQEIYATYDANWRAFLGSAMVQALAEFEHLLDPQLVKDVLASLTLAAVGEMRRDGTLPDKLILGYTNPQLIGTFMIGWLGHRLNNQTFIDEANTRGEQLYELFTANGSNTFTEYNCPTYYGVDIFGLASAIKYGPKDSTLTKRAPFMLTELWKDIAEHYNPYLGNMAGPYDRAYARDMPTHSAIVGQWWWGMFGYEKAPVPWKGNDDFRYDLAQGPSLALLMSTVKNYITPSIQKKLFEPIKGERLLKKTIREDLKTNVFRCADSWPSNAMMIGGQTLAEVANRGKQFTPAIIHWASDPSHTPFPYGGWFSLYPTASTITTKVGARSLEISYPNTTQEGTSLFTYMISGIPPTWNLAGNVIDGFSKLPCLSVNVSAPGLEIQPTNYYGNVISNQYYYNVTYVVPVKFSGVPTMNFDLEYTC
ncbi:hypothetical protein BCR34DRAFT_601184 [Clohesyomyces aquaticus]|uniref:Six-hairpin glycosidase-like protein n=1 Tax=Clohesyomyces aquaticus TaxID=1231657 RepID=A0A1Y1ZNE6_9PLEO|nr:hypothetical protein BCR34DRAFT_601184 [Clohesyomyces aquaticus]